MVKIHFTIYRAHNILPNKFATNNVKFISDLVSFCLKVVEVEQHVSVGLVHRRARLPGSLEEVGETSFLRLASVFLIKQIHEKGTYGIKLIYTKTFLIKCPAHVEISLENEPLDTIKISPGFAALLFNYYLFLYSTHFSPIMTLYMYG